MTAPVPKTRSPGARAALEMAVNRVAFSLAIGLYLLCGRPSGAEVAGLAGYVGFAVLLLGWLLLRPERGRLLTIGLSLVADTAMITLGMLLDGAGNAGFYPLYLWVILGYGIRLGLPALVGATILSLAGFGSVVATIPFWRGHPALAASLLLSLLVLPLYASTLIRRLSRALREAEEANHAKGMFLAAISHELRTPLNAILGSVSLIEEMPLGEEQRSLFDAIRTGTRALLSLIGGILDFSRLEAGRMPVSQEAVDLPTLLAEIRDLVVLAAQNKGLQLSLHAAADVPLTLTADRKHVLEILLNLASNAVKFTQVGGVSIGVERLAAAGKGTAARPERLRFDVQDTGIGIAPEALAHIFDAFSQADSSILDRFGGTGLGLAICRQLVTLMGGEIGVESHVGHGSRFWFSLPLQQPHVTAGEGADEAPLLAEPSLPGRAVLLCDDPALAESLEARLNQRGLAVRQAASVTEVVAPLGGRPPGEILLIYRRDPGGDLPGDCALLSRLDPQAGVPRVLLSRGDSAAVPAAMLRRHFITELRLPLDEAALDRACRLAGATTRAEQVAQEEPAERSELSAPAARGTRPMRILVADDNETNRRVVRMILERAGHHVVLTEDGMEAMDAAEDESFDLVLMDVNMPRMNGLETTRMLRIAMPPTPHLPILALTADATAETERRCLDAGMDGCVIKPITPARLLEAVQGYAPAPAPSEQGAAQTGAAVSLIADHPRFSAGEPALDQGVLDELRALGGDQFVEELLDGFQSDASELVERIEAAVEAGDMNAFRFELHAVRSAASNIGAVGLRRITQGREITPPALRQAGAEVVRQLRHELTCLDRELAAMKRAERPRDASERG